MAKYLAALKQFLNPFEGLDDSSLNLPDREVVRIKKRSVLNKKAMGFYYTQEREKSGFRGVHYLEIVLCTEWWD